MKKNTIVIATLALMLSCSMLFPAVSSATEAATSTDPFSRNIEVVEEVAPVDETTADEELYGEMNRELTQEQIDYLEYWDQLDQLDIRVGKAVDTYNNAPKLTNVTRKQIFINLNNMIVPNYTKYVSDLKQMQPANPELAAIHQKVIRGSYLQLEAMMIYKKAVSKTKINWTLYDQINPKSIAGIKLIEQAKAELYEYENRIK